MSDFGKMILGFGALAVVFIIVYQVPLNDVASDIGWAVIGAALIAGVVGLWKLIRS